MSDAKDYKQKSAIRVSWAAFYLTRSPSAIARPKLNHCCTHFKFRTPNNNESTSHALCTIQTCPPLTPSTGYKPWINVYRLHPPHKLCPSNPHPLQMPFEYTPFSLHKCLSNPKTSQMPFESTPSTLVCPSYNTFLGNFWEQALIR